MSLTVSNISIQLLNVDTTNGEVSLKTPESNIQVTDKLSAFVDALHNIYNSKGSKSYAHFVERPESELPNIDHKLTDYLSEELDFNEFCKTAGQGLAQSIANYDIAESGYLIICHYEHLGGRFLLVTLLPTSEHFYVDGELNISANEHIDTTKLQLAARVDLFEYTDNKSGDRYISFIKGRAGRKVADFFLEFLGCEEGINAKEQSESLVKAIEDFVNVSQLDPSEKQDTRKEVVSYCKEQQVAGKEVSLKELSASIPQENNTDAFYQFCQQQDYGMEDNFPADTSVINKATKYSGYGGGISVSFERAHFGKDVEFDPHQERLIINKVPPNLKSQLLQLIEESTKQSYE